MGYRRSFGCMPPCGSARTIAGPDGIAAAVSTSTNGLPPGRPPRIEFRTSPRSRAARDRAALVSGPASGTSSPTAPRSSRAARSPRSSDGTTTTRSSADAAGTAAVAEKATTTIETMTRRAYGRDFGLSARMVLTMFLLGALYVAFFAVLLSFTDLGIGFIIVIMGVLAFVQYYTSDKIALAASRAKIVDRGEALITGAPENLMSALQRIAGQIAEIPQRDLREVQGMNAFFIVPTNWRRGGAALFMTHPPPAKRRAPPPAVA